MVAVVIIESLLDFSLFEARRYIPLIELLRRLIAGRMCRRV